VYDYRVSAVSRVVDGDTYDLVLRQPIPFDFGFYIKVNPEATVRVRLLGWDTPETRSGSAFERSCAATATALAMSWWAERRSVAWVHTEKADDFGRWLGRVWCDDDSELGEVLAGEGLATPWPTRWRDVYDKRGVL
jgi:endonuclease YncB( thermonuclease family)